MKHPARWVALTVALIVVVFGVVLAVNVGNDPQEDAQQSPFLGKQVPTFDLPTLAGAQVSNASTAGKSVIINFWNTWCTPCRQELPELKKFYAEHANDPDFVMTLKLDHFAHGVPPWWGLTFIRFRSAEFNSAS